MKPTYSPRFNASDTAAGHRLLRHLAFGTYSAVHVPTPQDEAVKNYTRLRNTHKESLKKAK